MLAAVVCLSLMEAGLKTLSARDPPFQVAALPDASSLPFVPVRATIGPMRLLQVAGRRTRCAA
jgi:hypothetical protein